MYDNVNIKHGIFQGVCISLIPLSLELSRSTICFARMLSSYMPKMIVNLWEEELLGIVKGFNDDIGRVWIECVKATSREVN